MLPLSKPISLTIELVAMLKVKAPLVHANTRGSLSLSLSREGNVRYVAICGHALLTPR